MALIFSTTDKSLIVGGNTFYAKEDIKALGGKWEPSSKTWALPIQLDSTSLRTTLQDKRTATEKSIKETEKAQKKAEKAYAASPEGRAAAAAAEHQLILNCLEQKKTTGAYHWICCDKCVVIDWKRQHTSCSACAHDGNTFRVRGSIYTGD